MVVYRHGARNFRGDLVEMAYNAEETRRCQLLGVLFGSDVPRGLEGQLLRTSDVAMLFQVSERTVSEWAKRGQIPSVRTPGGHRRYPAEGIRTLLEGGRDGDEHTDGGAVRAAASVTDLSERRPASA